MSACRRHMMHLAPLFGNSFGRRYLHPRDLGCQGADTSAMSKAKRTERSSVYFDHQPFTFAGHGFLPKCFDGQATVLALATLHMSKGSDFRIIEAGGSGEAGAKVRSALTERLLEKRLLERLSGQRKLRARAELEITSPFRYIKSKAKTPTRTLISSILTSLRPRFESCWKLSKLLLWGSIATISESRINETMESDLFRNVPSRDTTSGY